MSEATADPAVPARPNAPSLITARTAGRDARRAGAAQNTNPYDAGGIRWERDLRAAWDHAWQYPNEAIILDVTEEGVVADNAGEV